MFGKLLRERLWRGVAVPVFAFESAEEPSTSEGEASAANAAPVFSSDAKLLRQYFVVGETRMDGGRIFWQDAAGQETFLPLTELRTLATHLLRLRKATTKGGIRENYRSALLRWIAFADATPHRALTLRQEDAAHRQLAADFLREIAGKQRTVFTTRLRHAAVHFAEAEDAFTLAAAYEALRAALFYELRLPAIVQQALLSPPTEPLNDIARRELIYLARAGTMEMRTLAVRRLQSERHHSDALHTLEQLVYDSHGWVRAATAPC